MGDTPDTDVWVRRFSTVAALFIFAGVIGIPYAVDRAYRRWLNDIDLFVALGTRLEEARITYHAKRQGATDWAQVIFGALLGIGRARSEPTGSGEGVALS
jgi:hypothetical protein